MEDMITCLHQSQVTRKFNLSAACNWKLCLTMMFIMHMTCNTSRFIPNWFFLWSSLSAWNVWPEILLRSYISKSFPSTFHIKKSLQIWNIDCTHLTFCLRLFTLLRWNILNYYFLHISLSCCQSSFRFFDFISNYMKLMWAISYLGRSIL